MFFTLAPVGPCNSFLLRLCVCTSRSEVTCGFLRAHASTLWRGRKERGCGESEMMCFSFLLLHFVRGYAQGATNCVRVCAYVCWHACVFVCLHLFQWVEIASCRWYTSYIHAYIAHTYTSTSIHLSCVEKYLYDHTLVQIVCASYTYVYTCIQIICTCFYLAPTVCASFYPDIIMLYWVMHACMHVSFVYVYYM
jgi:hypothetical protein